MSLTDDEELAEQRGSPTTSVLAACNVGPTKLLDCPIKQCHCTSSGLFDLLRTCYVD